MATYTRSDGAPFTPYRAMVLGWRNGDTGSERAYANGVLIHEEMADKQHVALWLREAMSGFDGTTMIKLPRSGPKFTEELALGEDWSGLVRDFEAKIRNELGAGWNVEIRLNPVGEQVGI